MHEILKGVESEERGVHPPAREPFEGKARRKKEEIVLVSRTKKTLEEDHLYE